MNACDKMINYNFMFLLVIEMEIISEGKRFRLVHDDELPSILDVLEKHLPYALKVSLIYVLRWFLVLDAFLGTFLDERL